MTDLRFPKSHRLLNASDFEQVFTDTQIRVSHYQLLILARHNHLGHSRLGLVIAKKNVRLAHQRNRIKRILREHFRLRQAQISGFDQIILVRRGLDQLSNTELNHLLDQQMLRLEKKFMAYLKSSN